MCLPSLVTDTMRRFPPLESSKKLQGKNARWVVLTPPPPGRPRVKLIRIICQAACHGKTEHGIFVKFEKPSKTAVVLIAGVTISGCQNCFRQSRFPSCRTLNLEQSPDSPDRPVFNTGVLQKKLKTHLYNKSYRH